MERETSMTNQAFRKMIIDVTQTDIDSGTRRSIASCPLARALTRAFGRPVGAEDVVIDFNKGWRIASLPKRAIAFRNNFDAGRPVMPFEFEIEVEAHG